MRIKQKLTFGFLATAVIPILLLTTVSVNRATKSLHDEIHLNLEKEQRSAMNLYNRYIKKGRFLTKNFQNDEMLKSLLLKGNNHKTQNYMNKLYFPLYQEFGVECLDITDKNGFLIADAEKSSLEKIKFGEDRKHRKTISEVLSTGKAVTFLELEPEGAHKTDFWLNTAAPIYDDANNLIGTVNVGFSLLLVDDIKNAIGTDTIIYYGNEVLASTIVGFERADMATIDDPKILSKVLEKGETYSTEMKINGIDYESSFLPIRDDSEKITGMLSNLVPTTRIKTTINKMRNIQLGLLFLFIVIVFYLSFKISRSISIPIMKLREASVYIAQGNMDVLLDIKTGDEIEELSNSFNKMIKDLKKSKEDIIEYNRTLEQKVEERTKELKDSQEKLVQTTKMAAVGQLAGGVAHEINNPMGVILGFSQIVVKDITEDNPLYMPLKSIEREAIRCKKLVGDLLIFSRADKTQAEIVNINTVIEDTLMLVEVEAQVRVKGVEIIKEYGKDIPQTTTNKNQIQQVIMNLCNNAIDAMPKSGRITITTKKTENQIEIDISDTGKGMTEEVKKHIFEPFFTTKEVGKGTGLGLSLCYEIVQKHNGTIEVESEIGKGTTFKIKLPIK
ncbi:MAG: hypothetical protein A2539_05685 [Elusimicrobia bacterium RIFOXYD2_FULL_34_15]|nr:MAG: hypothetical protein A2539_05685 [Elusimicrobia bacterium RIFOXYD2_FULL_34_15]